MTGTAARPSGIMYPLSKPLLAAVAGGPRLEHTRKDMKLTNIALLLTALVALALVSCSHGKTGTQAGTAASMIARINTLRTGGALSTLTVSDTLNAVAQAQAAYNASQHV